MKRLITARDRAGVPMQGFEASDYVDRLSLVANVKKDHAVPAGARWVFFSPNANLYVNFAGDATVPGADIVDGTASVQNPGLRGIEGVTTISLIATEACAVTMEFFS